MTAVLHLLKSPDTALARAVPHPRVALGVCLRSLERDEDRFAGLPAGVSVRRLDGDLSYGQLVELIFAADQVVSW